MTSVHSLSVRPQSQQDTFAVHGNSSDNHEDHVMAVIAEAADISFEAVAEIFASQLASLRIGAARRTAR
jgi:hypothetical protein